MINGVLAVEYES